MNKLLMIFVILLCTAGCKRYTPEQRKAATFVCDCIQQDKNGIKNSDILYFICLEEQAKAQFDTTIFTSEGFANALFEICPEENLVQELEAK